MIPNLSYNRLLKDNLIMQELLQKWLDVNFLQDEMEVTMETEKFLDQLDYKQKITNQIHENI